MGETGSGDSLQLADSDLPALHRAADLASRTAQQIYLSFFRADLVLTVIGAAAGAWAFSGTTGKTAAAIVGAIALFGSAVLTWIIQAEKYERDWYGGRAIAESVKTLAWRYATCAEPFLRELEPKQADSMFVDRLRDVLREREYLGAALACAEAAGDQITDGLQRLRESDVASRLKAYIDGRIVDQQSWYAGKAASSRKARRVWFFATSASQVLGVLASFALVKWPDSRLNAASVFATLAAAFLAWLQVKQSQELAQSYALAAHELGMIKSDARHVDSESALAVFVGDAENAISREHTLWIARRDQA